MELWSCPPMQIQSGQPTPWLHVDIMNPPILLWCYIGNSLFKEWTWKTRPWHPESHLIFYVYSCVPSWWFSPEGAIVSRVSFCHDHYTSFLGHLKLITCFTPEIFQEPMRERRKTTQLGKNTQTLLVSFDKIRKQNFGVFSVNFNKRCKQAEVKHGITFKRPYIKCYDSKVHYTIHIYFLRFRLSVCLSVCHIFPTILTVRKLLWPQAYCDRKASIALQEVIFIKISLLVTWPKIHVLRSCWEILYLCSTSLAAIKYYPTWHVNSI